MLRIRHERVCDVDARETLIDRAFGAARYQKTAERLREGRMPAERLSFVAEDDFGVVGTVRLWHVSAGPARRALLLGPLVVDDARRGLGIGAHLMRRATEAALRLGHQAILLVGDAPYYGRFGFSAEKTGSLWLPGPYQRHRLLALELAPGALANAGGPVSAAGELLPNPALSATVAPFGQDTTALAARAA